MNNLVTINSRKFDGTISRSWNCTLLNQTEDYWLFFGEFENEVSHPKLGVIRRKTKSFEYYFKEKLFNVFRFHEPEGQLKYFYCNINLPPVFNNEVLDYIDLDIDVLVNKDLTFEILDEDEFEMNSVKFQYQSELINKVNENLHSLLSLIENRSFPFDFE